MEEDNIHVDMEEVLAYRKRPYRCVKRPKTTDTENSCDSSESITVFLHNDMVFFCRQELLPYLYCLLPYLHEYCLLPYLYYHLLIWVYLPTTCLPLQTSERAAILKLEGGNKYMEEDNIHVDMEEVLAYRKRPYRCVKKLETTDTENRCDSSIFL
jgi:hypothetical protein